MPDPKIDIKIDTAAKTAEIERTLRLLKELEEVEKRRAKIQADVTARIAAMDKAEQEALRTQRVFGDESAQMADHLSRLTKETKEAGVQSEKTASKKSQLFAGLKKLGQEIPLVGYALSALKNPFTALGIAAALAVKAVQDYKEAIDRMAESIKEVEGLQGRITKFFELIAESKRDSAEFAQRLKDISGAAETAADWLKKTNDQIERKFKLEEEAAGLAGPDDPNAAQRANRMAAEKAQAIDNARRRAAEQAAAALAQLPAARQAVVAAAGEAKVAERRLNAQDQDDTAREDFLKTQNEEIKANLKRSPLLRSRLSADPPFKFRSAAELEEQLQSNMDELRSIDAARSMRQADRVRAQAPVAAARNRVAQLESVAESATTSARDLGREATAAFGAIPGPTGAPVFDMAAQRRMDAQSNRLAVRQAVNDREIIDAIREIFSDLAREIRELKQRERGTAQRE